MRRAWLAPCVLGMLIGWAPAQERGAAPDAVDLDAPAGPQELQMLARVNLCRQAVALPPLELDPALSRGVRLHGWYLDRHDLMQHEETPGTPGYTAEGNAAGMASVLAFSVGPEAAADGWIDSFFHRFPLLRPGLHRAGVGWVPGRSLTVSGIDGIRGHDPSRERNRVVLWPAPDMVGVRPTMSLEDPNPTSLARSDQAGYPVTATFHPAATVTGATATLREGAAEVACWISSPDHPQSSARPDLQRNSIGLIPKAPLRHKRRYEVAMSATVDGTPWQAAWGFTVGNPRDGIKWMQGVLALRAAQARKARRALERERDTLVRKLKYAAPDARPALEAAARELLARLPQELQAPLRAALGG